MSLQERVRQFNLGTPTPMHVGTHELVNELWRANADMLALLRELIDIEGPQPGTAEWARKVNAAIAKATGARP